MNIEKTKDEMNQMNQMLFKGCKVPPVINRVENVNNFMPLKPSQTLESLGGGILKPITDNYAKDSQVDVFKNYVISGKIGGDEIIKNQNKPLPNFVLKSNDSNMEDNQNNISKPQKQSLFKRLFKRLRRRRIRTEISNDTLTSMNTEFNRWFIFFLNYLIIYSYLNKTAVSYNTSELNTTATLTPHSKSVNFMDNVTYIPQSSSIFEEFDRDQEEYHNLKKQSFLKNFNDNQNHNLKRELSISKKNDIKIQQNIAPVTVVTFFIGADNTPFKLNFIF